MRPYRTVLEQKIRERRQTFEEFAEYVETFAREHKEPGTLSVRHLQRLVSGRRPDGRPLGQVHVVTARLLERILDLPIEELLAPPTNREPPEKSETELRKLLRKSFQVDDTIINLLHCQLDDMRHIDRQLGSTIAHNETVTKATQVASLLSHTTSTRIRRRLASLLSELYCLAGWQALDLGIKTQSWNYYDLANSAALEADNYAYKALAEAGRAFVLVDIGDTAAATNLMVSTRRTADSQTSRMTRSWLSAAYGEVFSSAKETVLALHAFDRADNLLAANTSDIIEPYMALDAVHLARWRGHALARCGHPEAVGVLTRSLHMLDPTFIRAETGLRVDLAHAFTTLNEPNERMAHARKAAELATTIGSERQRRRLDCIVGSLDLGTHHSAVEKH